MISVIFVLSVLLLLHNLAILANPSVVRTRRAKFESLQENLPESEDFARMDKQRTFKYFIFTAFLLCGFFSEYYREFLLFCLVFILLFNPIKINFVKKDRAVDAFNAFRALYAIAFCSLIIYLIRNNVLELWQRF